MKCNCCGQEIREPTSDMFNEFWAIYPAKVGKKKCYQTWRSRKLDRITAKIIFDVRCRIENDPRWQAGYVPNPGTYLNGDRWEDEIVLQPKVMQWPKENKDWEALAKQHSVPTRAGESWPEFKARIMRAVG